MHMHMCLCIPIDMYICDCVYVVHLLAIDSFYRQIAGYRMGVGDHRVG